MATRVSDTRTSLRGVHVLLVDDEAEALAQIKKALEYCGAVVTARETARRALAVTRVVKPSVLLIGLEIPADNAYWLIRNIRAAAGERDRSLPAIALMPLGSSVTNERIASEGFQTSLRQPVHVSELCDAIARVVVK